MKRGKRVTLAMLRRANALRAEDKTQAEIAHAIGVSRTCCWNILNGRYDHLLPASYTIKLPAPALPKATESVYAVGNGKNIEFSPTIDGAVALATRYLRNGERAIRVRLFVEG